MRLIIIYCKVNGYTFRGSNSVFFSFFASLLNGAQLLMERICSSRSKFFSLRVDHIFKGLHCPGKSARNLRSFLHWKKFLKMMYIPQLSNVFTLVLLNGNEKLETNVFFKATK